MMVTLTRADLRSLENAISALADTGMPDAREFLEGLKPFILDESEAQAFDLDLSPERLSLAHLALTEWVRRFDPAGRAETIGNLRSVLAKVEAARRALTGPPGETGPISL